HGKQFAIGADGLPGTAGRRLGPGERLFPGGNIPGFHLGDSPAHLSGDLAGSLAHWFASGGQPATVGAECQTSDGVPESLQDKRLWADQGIPDPHFAFSTRGGEPPALRAESRIITSILEDEEFLAALSVPDSHRPAVPSRNQTLAIRA